MKKFFLVSVVSLVLVVFAFMGGRWMERTQSGYHYEVLQEKAVRTESDPVIWKSVLEYVGFPVMASETTLIEVDGRLIYKAKRNFQEGVPYAENVRVDDGLIQWDDGEYTFSLKMQKMRTGGSPTTPDMERTDRRGGIK